MDVVNVREFMNDGDTDDTQAIQNEVDFAYSKGLPFTFPHGEYKISSTIKLPKI